ncbi:hypothetical protein [Prescottella equi]|uniref:hypothetical protein n=1 Tax=Rhodococcus hoagii TaxID=43767 RepID=UPI0007CD7D71|nr:hypothetical protein [Prescottella equi]
MPIISLKDGMRPLDETRAELVHQLGALEKQFDGLRERLAPVLRPANGGRIPLDGGEAPESVVSPHRQFLIDQIGRVSNLLLDVGDLMDRLEV